MRKKILFSLILLAWENDLLSLPQGFHLKEGDAKPFVQNDKGAWVFESGKKTWIDWDSFNIDLLEQVRFQQSDESSRILNRVIGSLPSSILGELTSNGAVYLINENGILIGKEALIDTAGFIASTLNFSETPDQIFRFQGESTASVVNYGKIISPHGDIFLIGRVVENHGTMHTSDGRQGLLSGCDILIRSASSPEVVLRSDAMPDKEILQENPYAAAIRQSGEMRGKEIYLIAAEGGCEVEGTICADTEEKGGTIHILGDQVIIKESSISASGKTGGGRVLIGGDFQGNNPEIKNAQVTWVGKESRIAADATVAGDGGKVIVWSDRATTFHGKVSVRGGAEGGDGGQIEVSGKRLQFAGMVYADAPQGQTGHLLLDPTDISIDTVDSGGAFGGCMGGTNTYIPDASATDHISAATLSGLLDAPCNVTISTVGSAGAGPNNGSITVSNAVSWTSNSTLTLTAASFMVIASTVQSTNNGPSFTAMNFTANGGTAVNSNDGILISGSLSSLSGNINLTGTTSTMATGGSGVNLNGGTITTGSGAVTLTGVSQGTAGAGLAIQTANAIISTSGNITLSGKANSSATTITNGITISSGWSTPATSGDFIFQNCWGGTGNTGGSGVSLLTGVNLLTNGNVTATQQIFSSQPPGATATSVGSVANGGFISSSSIISNGGNIHIVGVANRAVTSSGFLFSSGVTTSTISTTGSGTIQITGVIDCPDTTSPHGNGAAAVKSGSMSTVNGSITIAGDWNQGQVSNTFTTAGDGVSLGGSLTSTTGNIFISGQTNATGTTSGGTGTNNGSGVLLTLTNLTTGGNITFGSPITDSNGLTSYMISGCRAGSAAPNSTTITAAGLAFFVGTTISASTLTMQDCVGSTASTAIQSTPQGGHGIQFQRATTIAANVVVTNCQGQGPSGCGFFCGTNNVTIQGANNGLSVTGASASATSTTGGCHGVSVVNATLQTTGSGGVITLSGSGGNSSGASHGINISGTGLITTATSNATISLTGTGGSGTGGGNGINLAGSTNSVTTVPGGQITLTGTGSSNGSASASHGVSINTNPWTPGSGINVVFGTCSGGSGTSSNGVEIAQTMTLNTALTFPNCLGSTGGGNGIDVATTGALIVTSGNLLVTSCTGRGPGGVGFSAAGTVNVQGSGNTIAITASPSLGTTGACHGISVVTGGLLQTSNAAGGTITLTGSGGASSTASHGINISGTGLVTTAANNAALTLTGTGGTGSGGGHGINIASSTNSVITGISGVVTLTGVGSSNTTTASHGVSFNTNAFTAATGTYSFTNCIGGAAASSFGIDFSIATTFPALNFSGCVGGSGANGHGWNIGAATSFPSLTVALGNITSGTGSGSIAINIAANVSATSGNLSLTAASQGTGASMGIQVTAGTVSVTGSNTLTLSGTGSSSNSAAYGVHLSGGTVTSVNGALSITGVGGSTAANGVRLEGGATISTTGSGAISFTSNSPSAGTGLGTCTVTGGPGVGANITFTSPVIWLTAATPTLSPQAPNTATFASTLDGTTAFTENLSLNTGTGNLAFVGAVGSITPFNAISLIGQDITFSSSVRANQATIQNNGTLTLGNSSSFSLTGNFTQTTTNPVSLGGPITNTGAGATISFAGPASLTNTVTLLASGAGSSIHFANTVDDAVSGTHGLTIQSATSQFDADLGGTTPLASLAVTATSTITLLGTQAVSVGPMHYTGILSLTGNTMLFDLGSQGITLTPVGGTSVLGAHNLTIQASNSTLSVLGTVDLSGSSGGNAGSLNASALNSATFSREILTQGGDNGAGAGGNGGAVAISSAAGSVSVHNINTSGGAGTGGVGGNAGNIQLQPASGYSGGFPIGLIVLNSDLSSGGDGNLVALGGTGTVSGSNANITLSANRGSYPTVATIVSSSNGNNLVVKANSFTMNLFETMTILGNITLTCPVLTLGDVVSLGSMDLFATTIMLNTHGDVSLLNNIGGFYTSPSLHFIAGSTFNTSATFVPSGATVNAQGLNLSPATFEPFLFFSGHVLNFDTTFQPNPPPTPTPSGGGGGGGRVEIAPANFIVQADFYKLAIADAELSDSLPVFDVSDFPLPFEITSLELTDFDLFRRKKLNKNINHQ